MGMVIGRTGAFCARGAARVVAVVAVTMSALLPAQGATQTIVKTGDAVPGGNGTFSTFSPPVLNDAGQVLFSGGLNATSGGFTDNQGIFLASTGSGGGGGGMTTIVRAGQPTPGGNGAFGAFSDTAPAALNNSGQSAFFGTVAGSTNNSSDRGIFLATSGGAITSVARRGELAPAGIGGYFLLGRPAINNTGQVAFFTTASSDDVAIFLRDAAGALHTVAQERQPVPGGNGVIGSLSTAPLLNNAGQVVFSSDLTGSTGGSDRGIFRGDGTTLTTIARVGQPTPDGTATFSFPAISGINDAGQVSFSDLFTGVFRGDGTTVTQIAGRGQPAPDGNGTFLYLGGTGLNNAGQSVVSATLEGTTGGTSDDSAVYRGSGGALTKIGREGDAAPGGNGSFSSLAGFAINNAGQVAVTASLTGTAGGDLDDGALYLFDDAFGLLPVAREGDAMLGSTIVALSVSALDPIPTTRSPLNDLGQLAYGFTLADGRNGIAVFTPVPEPTMLGSLVVGAVLVGRRRRCAR